MPELLRELAVSPWWVNACFGAIVLANVVIAVVWTLQVRAHRRQYRRDRRIVAAMREETRHG